jgi:hypothetical protein
MTFNFSTFGLCLLFFLTTSRYTQAQVSISGIVNSYTPVTAITQPACAACDVACIHTITVGDASSFAVGDKALIIQMKGADINTANAAGSGNVTAINNAGNYEFFEIGSIVGNVLTPRYPLIRSYTITGVVQVVRIPEYDDVNISAPLTGLDWDDAAGIGGVVAIDARKVTFNANIEMSGRGYQGIQMPINGTPDNCSINPATQFVLNSGNNSSYIKGDGIVINDNNTNRGRSPRANGGGSGVSGDSGGGGGSNYGAGGEGGKRWCDISGANAGGIGGFSLTPFLAQDKVFLGGAGGPGWVSTGNPSTAADGGGIVIIFADTIIGNGFTINNNGLSPVAVNPVGAPDGGGGGGAGGTVVLKTNTYVGNLAINAAGGQGQDLNTNIYHGPGGGGGGGVLLYSLSTLPVNLSLNITAGQGGQHNDGFRNDSRDGAIGGSISLYIPIQNPNYEGNVDTDLISTACDVDDDNDGITDMQEIYVGDHDGDGILDFQDPDFCAAVFQGLNGWNCATDGLPDPSGDMDGDGRPNFKDPDFPYCGGLNGNGACINMDSDGDGSPNHLDLDSDNDGIPDIIEAGGTDINGDGFADSNVDIDGDGLVDAYDNNSTDGPNGTSACSVLPSCLQILSTSSLLDTNNDGIIDRFPDTDGDGIPNYLDLDSDNDGIADVVEVGGTDANGDGRADGFVDIDGDGYNDVLDASYETCNVTYTNAVTNGNGTSVTTDNGVTNELNAIGVANGTVAQLHDDTDVLGLDFGQIIPAGAVVTVHWRARNNGTAANLGVRISSVNPGVYTNQTPSPLSTSSSTIGTSTITTTIASRFIEIFDAGAGDFQVDAVTWTFSSLIKNKICVTNIGTPLIVTGADTDGDGIPNSYPNGDSDGDGVLNHLDLDSDNDGIADVVEAGGTDANGDGRADNFVDADNDGFNDVVDGDPTNILPVGSDIAAANTADALVLTGADTDGDGKPNSYPTDDSDGDGILSFLDLDADNDGIADVVEVGGTDANGDGRADNFADADLDGFNDVVDGDPTNALPFGSDIAGTNTADALVLTGADTDGDGKPNSYPTDDNDADGILSFLDLDADNDGIADVVEAGGTDANGDGRADNFADADFDGFNDVVDGDPTNALVVGSDAAGANTANVLILTGTDTNGNGKPNSYINGDNDNDGILNFLDLDADNDGIADVIEVGGTDANGDGRADNFVDGDKDGFNDVVDGDPTNALAVGSDIAGANITDVLVRTGTDTNNDGRPNSYPTDDNDGDRVLNFLDLDADNDGIADVVEVGGTDANGDGRADNFVDADNDGFNDVVDGDPTNALVVGSDIAAANTADALVLTSADTNGDGAPDSYIKGDMDNDNALNFLDIDADNDGIVDILEVGGTDANGDGLVDGFSDTDGDGWSQNVDGDTNNDATIDNIAGVLILTSTDTDGDGKPESYVQDNQDADILPNFLDIDADNDGIVDNTEAQLTANYIAPANVDSDGDGLDDAYELPAQIGVFGGQGTLPTNTDGLDNPDYLDTDTDNDGILDIVEGHDTNNDGIVNGSDSPNANTGIGGAIDADRDGLLDGFDNNTASTNATNTNLNPNSHPNADNTATNERDWREAKDNDQDGIPNNIDLDDDNDGITDLVESGGSDPLADADGDGILNYLDPSFPSYIDSNGDGINDNFDADQDGIINSFDRDSDNDGIADVVEAGGTDTNGDGILDGFVDADNDGLSSLVDLNNGGSPLSNPDTDNDGIPNYLDLDSDNDGIADVVEAGGTDANGDGRADNFVDNDKDGFNDVVDGDPTNALVVGSDAAGANTDDALILTGADTNGDGSPDSYLSGDFDGDGLLNMIDLDADNDGIADVVESGGKDADNNGIADNYSDTDGDGFNDDVDGDVGNDGIAENTANVQVITGTDTNGDGNPNSYPAVDDADRDKHLNFLDLDSDNDGITDVVENNSGATNGAATSDNPTGLGTLDGFVGNNNITDANNNGWHDASEGAVFVDSDNDGIADIYDIDADNDGIADYVEATCSACPTFSINYPTGTDANENGILDQFENVTDANGVAGPNFGLTPNNQDGTDNPDYLDLDTDNDTGMDWAEGFDNGFGTATAGDANAAHEIIAMAAFYAAQYELIFGSVCGCYPNIDADGDGLPVWLDSDDNLVGYDPLIRPLFLNPASIYWVDEDNDGLADIFDEFINTTPVGSFSEVPDADAIDDRDWRDTRIPVTFPIELLEFNAVRTNPNDVKLYWATASEINNEGFDIERMLDNETDFQKVGFKASTGTTNVVNHYDYIDRNPYPGVSYYRLRQVDIDGNFVYTPVRAVYGENVEQKDPAAIFPNPADNVLNVRFGQLSEISNNATIRIIDGSGKVLQNQNVSVASYQIISLNVADYPAAAYAIHILYADGSNQILKFIRE